uniref:Uncharacterized protein n=1 Tax=Rhipicephalus zambeziensis TaxID=60191 RepID=A0A224Y7H2_9ACAR
MFIREHVLHIRIRNLRGASAWMAGSVSSVLASFFQTCALLRHSVFTGAPRVVLGCLDAFQRASEGTTLRASVNTTEKLGNSAFYLQMMRKIAT